MSGPLVVLGHFRPYLYPEQTSRDLSARCPDRDHVRARCRRDEAAKVEVVAYELGAGVALTGSGNPRVNDQVSRASRVTRCDQVHRQRGIAHRRVRSRELVDGGLNACRRVLRRLSDLSELGRD